MTHRITALAAALAFVLTATPAAAQPAHSLVEGATALQFGIGPNLNLGTFSGGNIAFKRHTAPDRATRVGVNVMASHEANENFSDRTRTILGGHAHFIAYPTLASDPGGAVQAFWGAGPFVRYQMERMAPPDVDATTVHMFVVGGSGLIGAEWFVRPRVSLTAEYQTSLGIGFGTDQWSLDLRPDGVRAGVSVYFLP